MNNLKNNNFSGKIYTTIVLINYPSQRQQTVALDRSVKYAIIIYILLYISPERIVIASEDKHN